MHFRYYCFPAIAAIAMSLTFTTVPAIGMTAEKDTAISEKTSGDATAIGTCENTDRYEICLTKPDSAENAIDLTIVQRLRDYVQETDEGAITGAMMLWELDEATPDTKGLVDDLIAAKDRGVAVNLVLGNPGSRNDETIDALRAGDIDPTICTVSCLPGEDDKKSGNMHIKFFLFSDSEKVVHTSSNLSKGQYQKHQNLISSNTDRRMYYNYVDYWNRLSRGTWTYKGDTWKSTDRARTGDVSGSKVYFYPRTKADPVRGTLEKLTCSAGNDKVWVAASLFHHAERLPVLNVLDELHDNGCDVRMVLSGDTPQETDREWVLKNSGIPEKQVRELDGAGEAWGPQHNKLIVTNANYEGQERTAVYAGSHNLNKPSLRNSSDGMLRVTDADVYEQYEQYYEDMYELAHI